MTDNQPGPRRATSTMPGDANCRLWAVALAAHARYGPEARHHIARRISRMGQQGHWLRVEQMFQVVARLGEIDRNCTCLH